MRDRPYPQSVLDLQAIINDCPDKQTREALKAWRERRIGILTCETVMSGAVSRNTEAGPKLLAAQETNARKGMGNTVAEECIEVETRTPRAPYLDNVTRRFWLVVVKP
jgi:Zn ribbon nucleic-acid-binding protein